MFLASKYHNIYDDLHSIAFCSRCFLLRNLIGVQIIK